MPDIIRPATAGSTVVVTISSVADQSTLDAVSPTVSATINGSSATITAWAWKVNGATTGITGPTTATPSYTPTTAGAKVITVDVTILGVVYSSLPEIFTVGPTALSVSIAAVSDQLDLSAATLDSTVTGGVTPYTYAWTVNGATTGLSSSTAADPTYTPTAAGTPTAVVTVTDGAGQVAKASVTWRVGTTGGWVRVWKYLPSEQANHNFLTTDLVVSGVTIKKLGTGTSQAISSGVHTTVTASGSDLGIYIRPIEALASPGQYEVCFIAGCGANITANSDGMYVFYQWSGGSTYIFAEARRDAGVQRIARERPGSTGSIATSGGSQARVVGLHLTPGRYQGRPLYSPTAWSGDGPSPDDLTVGGGTPSGWHVSADVTPVETADEFFPDNAVGAGHDACWVAFRGNNSRTYTLAGFSMWARLRPG